MKKLAKNIRKTKIMASSPITSWQIDRETMKDVLFWGVSKITAKVTAAMQLKDTLLGRKAMMSLDNILKSRDYFANKGPSSQSYGSSSSYVWMWELGHKESWMPKNWRFWTVVLEKTLESPLDCKEIKPVNPKEN